MSSKKADKKINSRNGFNEELSNYMRSNYLQDNKPTIFIRKGTRCLQPLGQQGDEKIVMDHHTYFFILSVLKKQFMAYRQKYSPSYKVLSISLGWMLLSVMVK